MKRKLGINWSPFSSVLTEEEHIGLLTRYGFESVFLGLDEEVGNLPEEEILALVDRIRASGIDVENFHAPFDKINELWKEGTAGDEMTDRLCASVALCRKAKVPVMICHLATGVDSPAPSDIGIRRLTRLMECAGQNGVQICFENQRYAKNLAYLSLALEFFPAARFCWDCGHEFALPVERHYMPIYGQRLAAVHIQDILSGDDHMIPGDGRIDFSYVTGEISRSPYRGPLMLEVLPEIHPLYRSVSAEGYYARASAAGKRLLAMMEMEQE